MQDVAKARRAMLGTITRMARAERRGRSDRRRPWLPFGRGAVSEAARQAPVADPAHFTRASPLDWVAPITWQTNWLV
jgi:hypothetical protein